MPRPILTCLVMLFAIACLVGCQKTEPAADTGGAATPATPARFQSAAAARKLAAAQTAARRHPQDAAVQMDLGRLAYDEGAYNDAYRAYRRAAELQSTNYEAIVGLAKTNLKLQNPTEGLDWLLRAKRLKPGGVELKELEARLLLVNGNFDRAITTFEQAIKMNPKRTTTWLNLASAYALMNRPDEAVKTAREAVKIDPYDPAPHFALGRHMERAGNQVGAEAEYRQALARDANNAPAMIALARLLMDQNRRLEEARQMAVKASQIRTDRADAGTIAAWILHLQGDDRKAANELIKLVNASPQNPEAWQKLSVVLSNIGKPNESKQAAEMAQRFIPGRRASADLQMLDSDSN